MYTTILLPIDLTHPESWEKALPAALDLAHQSGGTIHILGIVPAFGMSVVATYFPPDFEAKALKHMKDELDSFAAKHIPKGTSATAHVGHGNISDEILSAAQKNNADIIVMAAHKPDDFREFLVGSNATRVVQHADKPVLVVR